MPQAKVLLLFTLFPFFALAQKSIQDTLSLPEVSIKSSRFRLFTVGVKALAMDSMALKENYNTNMTELLSTRAPVYIKDYGGGSLATISFRGTNSYHTQVNWNGFPINSSTTGDIDFSLIPVSLLDNINLVFGGSGSLYGSGAVGGSVNLNNAPTWIKGSKILVSDEQGSFSTNRSRARIILGNGKLESSTSLFLNNAKNNYPFINTALAGSPLVLQTNSAVFQYGALQSLSYKLNDKNIFSASLWYQNSHREIPPSMTVPSSAENQQDSSTRTFAGWTRKTTSGSLNVRGAYFSEALHFKTIGVDDKDKVNKYMSELEWRNAFLKKRLLTDAGASFLMAEAFISEYGGKKTQPRGGGYAGIKYLLNENWTASVSARKDFVQDYHPPFAPSVGIEGKVFKKFLIVKSNVCRTYRIPTLNDRFWQPGGNPNLKSEMGWSSDLGVKNVTYLDKKKNHFVETEITIYNSVINNYIQWIPISAAISSPVNVDKVWARGLEVHSYYSGSLGKFTTQFTGNYSYTLSTNLNYNGTENFVGNQLIYVPRNVMTLTAHLEYKGFFISYNQTYTGLRYTDAENDQFVNGYTLGNVYVGKKFIAPGFKTYLQLKTTNVWDVQYQNIQWYAMPGRAFYLSAQFEFTTKNKTKKL